LIPVVDALPVASITCLLMRSNSLRINKTIAFEAIDRLQPLACLFQLQSISCLKE